MQQYVTLLFGKNSVHKVATRYLEEKHVLHKLLKIA